MGDSQTLRVSKRLFQRYLATFDNDKYIHPKTYCEMNILITVLSIVNNYFVDNGIIH